MSTEETQGVLAGFLSERGGHWLAEDVELRDASRAAAFRGRTAVVTHLTDVAGRRVVTRIVVADDLAAVEWSDGDVAAFYEIRAGEIAAVRLYDATAALDRGH